MLAHKLSSFLRGPAPDCRRRGAGFMVGGSTIVDVASLLVVTGPLGAGKPAVAQMLALCEGPSVLVEGDLFSGFFGERCL